MDLNYALRLNLHPKLALVGSGGKTTALFTLARELPGPILVTTSTHLGLNQTSLADHHFILNSIEDAENLLSKPISGVVLLTGNVKDERVEGLSPEILSKLNNYCTKYKIPLLIEADGSRQRPLKAPASHEPPIPNFVELVIVVAGLSALGKPLNSETVYQPETFSKLSDISMGEEINSTAVIKVLTHEFGGLKNIPPDSKKVALLNQCDTEELRRSALLIKHRLISDYQAVLTCSTIQDNTLKENQVVNQSQSLLMPKIHVSDVYEPVAAVVLAAGSADRMGRPKQLLSWKGKPLVWHSAKKAILAGLSPVVVVCGAYHNQVKSALSDLSVTIVENKQWQEGQGTSVCRGVKELPKYIGSAVFLLADQPLIPVGLIRKLVMEHSKTLSNIVTPWIDNRSANPVLFDRKLFSELLSLSGEEGGRALFSHYDILKVNWNDPTVFFDVDTEEDYNYLLQSWSSENIDENSIS